MTGELIEEFGDELVSTILVKGPSGVFDVTVDGRLVFSKKAIGRHANPGEVIELIRTGQMATQAQ